MGGGGSTPHPLFNKVENEKCLVYPSLKCLFLVVHCDN